MNRFRSIFIMVCLLIGVTRLAKADGEVWATGDNAYGELGNDDAPNDVDEPVQTHTLTDVVAIAAGCGHHSLALKSDGTVWAWGWNEKGELGIGNTDEKHTPTKITTLSGIIAVDAEWHHSLALKSDGTVWAWGLNISGQLGDNTTTDRWEPVQTHNLTDVIAIAGGSRHSLALKSDKTVWAWGGNGYGQLGIGSADSDAHSTPIQVLTDVIAIDGGGFHSLAIKSDKTVWAWGANQYGQLGVNDTTQRHAPVQTHIYTNDVIAFAGGYWHSLALKSDSTVWAWGSNKFYGQLGIGVADTFRVEPVQTHNLTDVIAIEAGMYHSLALKQDGIVWGWGGNFCGQLGDGNIIFDQVVPVKMHIITGVDLIAGGWYHSLAVVDAPMGIEEQRCRGTEEHKLAWERYRLQVRGRGIYLFTPNAREVDIRVYDICGRLRQVVYKGVLSKGGHTFSPDIKRSGIYFVVLRTGKSKESLKIIKL